MKAYEVSGVVRLTDTECPRHRECSPWDSPNTPARDTHQQGNDVPHTCDRSAQGPDSCTGYTQRRTFNFSSSLFSATRSAGERPMLRVAPKPGPCHIRNLQPARGARCSTAAPWAVWHPRWRAGITDLSRVQPTPRSPTNHGCAGCKRIKSSHVLDAKSHPALCPHDSCPASSQLPK